MDMERLSTGLRIRLRVCKACNFMKYRTSAVEAVGCSLMWDDYDKYT
jgi:hypothetical protein